VVTAVPVPSVERQVAGGWLDAARQRLNELAALKPGWDEASAKPVSPGLLGSAWSFLTSELVSSLAIQPDIVPTFEGGLLIEWHSISVDLIIETSPDAAGSFYFCDNETHEEVEAAIGERLDIIATAFAKLGFGL
jgi:hypothetical protein